MRLVMLFFFFSALASSVKAQESIKKYVQENSVAISTISPDSLDFSDLAPIQKAIGNARIVMLGEQDHGDAATFLAKVRLIKYLHEKMGFDVLAFESDFFALNAGFDRLLPTFKQNPLEMSDFIRKSVYSIWTLCDTIKPFFDSFIPSTYTTSKPLLLTGFDNQMYPPYSSQHLISQLDSVLKANDLPITKRMDYQSAILPMIDSLKFRLYWQKDISVFDTCANYLNEIKNEMAGKFDQNSFWMMLVDNLIAENQQYGINYDKNTGSKKNQNMYLGFNIRDTQMARNLYWISNVKYSDKKIIVWAANAHIAKFSGRFKDKELDKERSMGTVFTEDLKMGNDTYVLGFTSYQGMTGRVAGNKHVLIQPKSNAFENWLPQQWEYGFVDFSKLNTIANQSDTMFYMRGSAVNNLSRSNKAVWNNVFDGVFYIKNMFPCTSTIKISDN